MSYDATWNDRAQQWADQEWISVPNVRALLKHMDSVKLAVGQSRQAALDYFAGMEKEAPFRHNAQFPNYITYVAIDQGDWPNKIRQMITALNFKDLSQTREGKERVDVATRRGNGGNGQGPANQPEQPAAEEPKDVVPNDVLLSFTTAIQNMRGQLGRREGTWTRTTMEAELTINWV